MANLGKNKDKFFKTIKFDFKAETIKLEKPLDTWKWNSFKRSSPRNPLFNNGSCSREGFNFKAVGRGVDVRGPRSGICSFPARYNPLMNWGTLKAVSNWNPVVRSISSGHSLRSGGRGWGCWKEWGQVLLGITQRGKRGTAASRQDGSGWYPSTRWRTITKKAVVVAKSPNVWTGKPCRRRSYM